MENSRHIRMINVVSVVLIVVSALTITGCILLQARPFAQRGSTPIASGTPAVSADSAWQGTFSNFLVCGIDNTNSLTDVIMLVSFNNSTGHINILQIPRDTYVGKDIPSGKYNAVYGHHPEGESGMEFLRARVEQDFGIPVNYYAAITTAGFRSLVDAAGGVDMDVPINMNYDDPAQDLHIHLKKGYQHLNGSQAEQFVRDRKDWAEGDIGRLQAQKSFLAAFADRLRSLSRLTLTTRVLPTLLPPNFTTDMTTLQMIQFGLAAKKVDLSSVTVHTMPGESFESNGISYYTVHKAELLAILNASFVPPGTVLKTTDLKIRQMADTNGDSVAGEGKNLQSLIPGSQSGSAASAAGR